MKTSSDVLGRRITTQFIAENPVDVVVTRRTKQATSAGGFKWVNPVDLTPQTMRRVLPNRVSSSEGNRRTDSSGRTVVPTANLVGQIDADIDRFDLVDLSGIPHEVVWVTRRDIFARTVAEVVQYAGS